MMQSATPIGPLQMYLLLYPKELEEEIIEVLDQADLPGYTELPKMIGRGRRPHLDNPIWPGSVGAVLSVIGPETSQRLIEPFRELDRRLRERSKGINGLHLFVLPCQQVI